MQFAFITPPKLSHISLQGDVIMILAQWLEDDKFAAEVKELCKTRKVYLDNGAHEGEFKGIPWFIEQIKKIDPYLVFCPDVFFDSEETHDLYIKFKDALYKEFGCISSWPFKLGYIIQSNNITEFFIDYPMANNDAAIDYIGINYACPPKLYPEAKSMCEARKLLLQEINKAVSSRDLKPIHLLGVSDGFDDVKYAADNLPYVKSCDTSNPFMLGIIERYKPNLRWSGGKIRSINFAENLNSIPDRVLNNVNYNIQQIKDYFS